MVKHWTSEAVTTAMSRPQLNRLITYDDGSRCDNNLVISLLAWHVALFLHPDVDSMTFPDILLLAMKVSLT